MQELMTQEEILKMLSVEPLEIAEAERVTAAPLYGKIPFSRLAALGVGLDAVVPALQQLMSGGKAMSGYYKVTIPAGTELARFKNENAFLGTVLDNGIAGQARLNPVVFQPTMLFAAAALASMDQKLDAILETQQEMLEFLVQKEKSALKGDLDFLTDILNNYKYNWNDEKYKSANHQKALDIRQHAGQMIDFYREQIQKSLVKKSFLHSNQDAQKQLNKVKDAFGDYQLALYLYGFAYFLEALLQENFDRDYLDAIASKIDRLSLQYRELYSMAYTQLESQAQNTLQSKVLGGLSAVNKAAGRTIAKIPVISKSPIDETLIAAGEKLGSFGEKQSQAGLQRMLVYQSGCVRPFIDQIQTLGRIYNRPMTLVLSGDALYLGAEG